MRIIDYPAPTRRLSGDESVASWQDGKQVSVNALAIAALAPTASTPLTGNGPPAATLGIEGSYYRDLSDPDGIQEWVKTASGWQGPSPTRGKLGKPGGNVMSVGLFTDLTAGSASIPDGTDTIVTAGHHIAGVGIAFYRRGTTANPGLPGAATFVDAAGAYWTMTRAPGGVDVAAFGAWGDYDPVTDTGHDDTQAFLDAADFLQGGGEIRVASGFRCLIAQTLDLSQRANIVLRGPGMSHVMNKSSAQVNARSGDMYVDPAATILLGNGCGPRGVTIMRRAIQFFITSAQVASQFLGTGITLADDTYDHVIEDVAVFGFLNGIVSQSSSGSPETSRTRFIGRVYLDCINCVRLYNVYDIVNLEPIQCWPFITYNSPPEPNTRHFTRNGVAFQLHGVNDWTTINRGFNYGWKTGYRVIDAGFVNLINAGCDYPYHSQNDDSRGITIEGSAYGMTIIAPTIALRDIAIEAGTTTSDFAATVLAPRLIENRRVGVQANQCQLSVTGGQIRSSQPGAIGLSSSGTGSLITASGVDFRGSMMPMSQDGGGRVTHHGCIFSNASVTQGDSIPVVASADPLVLNPNFQTHLVTGSVNFGSIANPQTWTGRQIRLLFDASPVVLDGDLLRLSGNFYAAPGASLTLESDGVHWWEGSRAQSATIGIPSIPLADPLKLDPRLDVFRITGNGGFGTISDADLFVARTVMLIFEGSGTAYDGGNVMILAGNFDFTPGSTLTLTSDGARFYEITRSKNA